MKMQKPVVFVKENFKTNSKYLKDKKYHKLKAISIMQENIEVLRIAYVI